MNHRRRIASLLQSYRRNNGLTLNDLSQITGLSIATISELEREKSNPTLSVMEILADTMSITLKDLLDDEHDSSSIVLRKNERKAAPGHNSGTSGPLMQITPPRSAVTMLLLTVLPGEKSNSRPSVHPYQEETALILKGTVKVIMDRDIIILNEGDSLRVLPGVPHIFENSWNEPAEILYALENSADHR